MAECNRDDMWEEVFSSIDSLLAEIAANDTNRDLNYHEAALLFNRLETALSVLRHAGTEQVLNQLCEMLTEIHRYWGKKLIQMRHTTVNLADLGPREVNRSTRPGDLRWSSRRNFSRICGVLVITLGQRSPGCFVSLAGLCIGG